MRFLLSLTIAVCACVGLLSCTTFNYTAPNGPRYAGTADAGADPEPDIRVGTFNIELGRDLGDALELIRTHPGLRDADVLFLQEMHAEGTEALADSLRLHWLYYPATISPKHGRDFGNAILSRWPIHSGRKVILPHPAWLGRSQRIAVIGEVVIEGREVTLCSTHLGLPFLVRPGGHRAQASHIADELDAANAVIVGGDMNSEGVGGVFENAGFSWPTRDLGATALIFAVDHLFTKGFEFARDPPAGIARSESSVGDHQPVWAVLRPASDGQRQMARRDRSFPIKHAAWIDSTLLRGARPGEKGCRALKAAGFRTVVNLTDDTRDREHAKALGLDYIEIPLTPESLGWSSGVARFLTLAQEPTRRPLFFHGVGGKNLTGALAALYRIEAEGWTNGEALREMHELGFGERRDLFARHVRRYVPRREPRDLTEDSHE